MYYEPLQERKRGEMGEDERLMSISGCEGESNDDLYYTFGDY